MKKSIAFAVALALTLPAWGQNAQPAAKTAAKPAPKAAAPKVAAHKSRRHEDARICLERGSNAEIIKCAEAYL